MKVLFVGEGNHEVGASSPNPTHLRAARGPVCILARKVCPVIAADSVALTWSAIPRFNPRDKKVARFNSKDKKRGYQGKIAGAVLIAARNGCAGSVFVADHDGDEDRLAALGEGVNQATEKHRCQATEKHRCQALAFGLAIKSVEAWTLAVPAAIADVLGVDEKEVLAQYPRGIDVEKLHEQSGIADHQPKGLLKKIAQLKHRNDSTEFREEVAEKTDIAALERACPKGFAPFAAMLRDAFG